MMPRELISILFLLAEKILRPVPYNWRGIVLVVTPSSIVTSILGDKWAGLLDAYSK